MPFHLAIFWSKARIARQKITVTLKEAQWEQLLLPFMMGSMFSGPDRDAYFEL